MYKTAVTKLLFILVTVLSIAIIAGAVTSTDNKVKLAPEESKAFSSPNSMKGLTYSIYDDNRLTSRIKADKFSIDNRKFWAFNIRPFKDAVLKNAVIQVYLNREPNGNYNVDMLSFSQDLINLGKQNKTASNTKGLVTRGVIRGFTMEIHESEGPSIIVKAKKAYVDSRNKKLKMVSVVMEDVSTGKLIKSRTVKWNNKENVFEIAGKYIARTKDNTMKGRNIKVDLDFNLIPLT